MMIYEYDAGYGRAAELHRVAAIHYEEVRPGVITPFDVTTIEEVKRQDGRMGTRNDSWDFEYSKTDDTSYFHNSGGGGGNNLHLNGGGVDRDTPHRIWFDRALVTPVGYRGGYEKGKSTEPLSDEEITALGYTIVEHPLFLHGGEEANPFLCPSCQQGETEFCAVCDDHLEVDYSTPCRHQAWSENHGCWAGCGAWHADNELFDAKYYISSFRALCDYLGVDLSRRVADALRAHVCNCDGGDESTLNITVPHAEWFLGERLLRAGADYHDGTVPEEDVTDAMELAIAWLVTLEPGTTDQFDGMAASWIGQCVLAEVSP